MEIEKAVAVWQKLMIAWDALTPEGKAKVRSFLIGIGLSPHDDLALPATRHSLGQRTRRPGL